jgi:hypothetical protein
MCLPCQKNENEESLYYSKKTDNNGKIYCHRIGKTGISPGKLIYGTNQIVNDCKELGYYQLGDICYDTCPINTKIEEHNKLCVCEDNFYYTKKIEDNLLKIECDNECPNEYPFYDGETKECLKDCPSEKSFLRVIDEKPNFYECLNSCPNKKYIKNMSSNKSITYCVDNCPQKLKYTYSDNTCVDKCNRNKYDLISSGGEECINFSTLENEDSGKIYYILVDSNAENYKIQTEASCPNEYPFKYKVKNKVFCLHSCEDTKSNFLNNTETFLNIEENNNDYICLEVNEENNNKYFINEEEYRYISDCSLDITGPYHYKKRCVVSCGNKYLVEETNECVDECNINEYYIDEETKMCVKQCPINLGRGFYYEKTKKCTPCLNPSGNTEENIGFHKKGERICYEDCPKGYKHIFNNNICFSGDCKNTDYKFTSSDFPNICFYNCPDIKDNQNNKYLIEIDFKCYEELPEEYSNYYFYEIKVDDYSNIKKYMEPTKALKECFKRGLKYIKDSQCIKYCDSDNFKVLPDKNKFGLCFENIQKCKENNYIYYNSNKKECSKQCDYFSILDDVSSNSNVEGNCVVNCHGDYDRIDGDICKNNCFYKEIGGKKICVESCFNNKGFSFYNEDKQCLDSCLNNDYNKKFSYEPKNEHQECIEKCEDDEYYYENEQICLKKCNKYYKISDAKKICIDTCESILLPSGKCIDDDDFKENPCLENDFPFLIKESNNKKKCVSNCFYNGNDYYYKNKNICSKIIPTNTEETFYYAYKGIIYVDECPDGFSDASQSCENGCSTDYFCNINGVITCSSENNCNDFKYITSSNEKVNHCPEWEHFIDEYNIHCTKSCSNFYEKMEDNEVEYQIYKCINSCSQSEINKLHQNGEKECIPSCGLLFEYNNVCYLNCKDITDSTLVSTYDSIEKKNVCKTNCDDMYPYLDTENNLCVEDCSILKINKITKGNHCISACTPNEGYIQIKDKKVYCVNECEEPNKKHYIKIGETNDFDNICREKCQNYIKYNDRNICLDTCNGKYIIENNEKICYDGKTTCLPTHQYYYEIEEIKNLCLESCFPGDYILIDSSGNDLNKCVKQCPIEDNPNYYIYDYDYSRQDNSYKGDACVTECSLTNKKIKRENKHCDISCDENPLGDYYKNENSENSECKEVCGEEQKIYGNTCKTSCNIGDFIDKK